MTRRRRCSPGPTAVVLLGLAFSSGPSAAPAVAGELSLSSAFTWTGRLDFDGAPARGRHDFEYELWTEPEGGELIGTLTRLDRPVEGGVFADELDFGLAALDTEETWLEIRVRRAGEGGFAPLGPRRAVRGAGGPCTTASSVVVENRLTVGTTVSHGSGALVAGPQSDPPNGVAALRVRSGPRPNHSGDLFLDGNEIDSRAPAVGPSVLHLNGASQGGVSIGHSQNAAPLHVGGASDVTPGSGGLVVLGDVTAANLALDRNEIMARDGGGVSSLAINPTGGDVVLQGGSSGSDSVVIGGTLDLVFSRRWTTHLCPGGPSIEHSPTCPAGTVVIGGGCNSRDDELRASFREGNRWTCVATGCVNHAFVMCMGVE